MTSNSKGRHFPLILVWYFRVIIPSTTRVTTHRQNNLDKACNGRTFLLKCMAHQWRSDEFYGIDTWHADEPRQSLRTFVTVLSRCGKCFWPLKMPKMTLPRPERVIPPPGSLVRSQPPKSIWSQRYKTFFFVKKASVFATWTFILTCLMFARNDWIYPSRAPQNAPLYG